jgi:chromosome partitioning protein
MIAAFIGLKGGTGKTCLSLATAACAQDDGANALLADTDPAGLATCWRPDGFYGCVSWPRGDFTGLCEATRGVDFASIDIATGDFETMRAAAAVANVLVIPCCPSPLDVQCTATLLDAMEARNIPEQCPVRVLLNRVDLRTSLGQRAQSDLQAAGFPMLETVIGDRVAMTDAIARGEFPNRADAHLQRELRGLLDELESVTQGTFSAASVAH